MFWNLRDTNYQADILEKWINALNYLDLPRIGFELATLDFSIGMQARKRTAQLIQFYDWYKVEKLAGDDWLKNVPLPPNCLGLETMVLSKKDREGFTHTSVHNFALLPDKTWVWDAGVSIPLQKWHPHASYGIRKRTMDENSGAQAMYDAARKIITSGLSAGTADKGYPGVKGLNHGAIDVDPFHCALRSDEYFEADKKIPIHVYRNATASCESRCAP